MMKKQLPLLFFVLSLSLYAQDKFPPLHFNYDLSGNQTLSDLVCINCPKAEEQYHIDRLNYYPNPVMEALNLNWENTDTDIVTTINVYTLNGRRIALKDKLNAQTEALLNFSNKAAGIYIIEVLGSDGKKSNFKIIKH